ncbi:hypothetical protein [Acidocella sp.]|uniref:hypothetical protein n=1 Tax=Acidocella sp. TaxID=50710 RepID=UPI0026376AC3|nr:hypothetical protein [Acidocella sp.]
MNRLPIAFLASLAAFPALARPDPTPPPSGIVVHLFGPDAGVAKPSPSAPSAPNAAAPQGPAASAPQASPATPEPSIGDILHEMFVTGDPAQEAKPRFAPGRAGD